MIPVFLLAIRHTEKKNLCELFEHLESISYPLWYGGITKFWKYFVYPPVLLLIVQSR